MDTNRYGIILQYPQDLFMGRRELNQEERIAESWLALERFRKRAWERERVVCKMVLDVDIGECPESESPAPPIPDWLAANTAAFERSALDRFELLHLFSNEPARDLTRPQPNAAWTLCGTPGPAVCTSDYVNCPDCLSLMNPLRAHVAGVKIVP
jgi:hypothetical protein